MTSVWSSRSARTMPTAPARSSLRNDDRSAPAGATATGPASPPSRRTASTSGPRHLMPLANKPILFHNLEALNRAGVLEAMIVVDPATADATREAVGDGSRWGLSVHYATASGRVPVSSGLRAGRDFV